MVSSNTSKTVSLSNCFKIVQSLCVMIALKKCMIFNLWFFVYGYNVYIAPIKSVQNQISYYNKHKIAQPEPSHTLLQMSSSTSRYRSSSLAPTKQKNQLTQLFFPSPDQKQYIIYSPVQKQSGLGMMFHQRVLLFESINKTLRYYSKMPDPLPHPQMPIPQGKEMIKIKVVKNFEFKSTKNGIGKVLVKWQDLNGQKKQWNLKFANNNLMTRWVVLINQARKQGHLQPENRPKNISRYEAVPKNIDKYLTDFIKETGGVEARKSNIQQSQVSGLPKNNSQWLSQQIQRKQRQMEQIHNQMHQPENTEKVRNTGLQDKNQYQSQGPSKDENKQKRQKQEEYSQNKSQLQDSSATKNENKHQTRVNSQIGEVSTPNPSDSIKTIKKQNFAVPNPFSPAVSNELKTKNPSIIMQETQSKVSNNNQSMESAKQFRINREPIPIEQDEIQVQDSAVRDENNKILVHDSSAIKEKQFVKQPYQSKMYKQSHKQNISQIISKTYASSRQPYSSVAHMGTNLHQQSNWLNTSLYRPYSYSCFLNKCQQLAPPIVHNLPQLVQQSQSSPTATLFSTPAQLFLTKHHIQFRIQINPSPHTHIQQQSSLKMKQFTNVVGYINRIVKNSLPLQNYGQYDVREVVVVPYCEIGYRFCRVKCKAIGMEDMGYREVSDRTDRDKIDKFFGMPHGLWKYYYGNSHVGTTKNSHVGTTKSGGVLVVEYQTDEMVIQSKDDDNALSEIANSIMKQQVCFSGYKDMSIHFALMHEVSLNSRNIGIILKKCLHRCGWHPSLSFLLCVLYSKKLSQQIKQLYIQKMQTFSQIQLTQAISSLLQSLTQKTQSQLLQQLHNQLSLGQTNLATLQRQLNSYTIYNVLLEMLGLAVDSSSSSSSRVRFVSVVYGVNVDVLCIQMEEVRGIVVAAQSQGWNQEAKFLGVERAWALIQEFQYLWNESSKIGKSQYSRSRPNTDTTGQNKYPNLYHPLFLYLSHYKPYQPTPSFPSLPTPSFPSLATPNYSHQLSLLSKQHPPTCYTYRIQINIIKWTIKSSSSTSQQIQSFILQCIENCKKWNGVFNVFVLWFYELYVAYCEEVYMVAKGVQYARCALETAMEVYGNLGLEAIEKWFVLGNCLLQNPYMCQQALQAYQKSLTILHALSQVSQSQKTEQWQQYKKFQAQLTIRLKLIKIYLSIGSITQCIDECSICLELAQMLEDGPNLNLELEIFGSLIRCLELNGEVEKLGDIIQVAGQKFGGLSSSVDGAQPYTIRQQMLKMCLSPYLNLHLSQANRKAYLSNLCQKCSRGRYTKKQYNNYIEQQLQQNSSQSILQWFKQLLLEVPLFSAYMRMRGREALTPDRPIQEQSQFTYSLYDNYFSQKMQPVTQNRHLIPVLRALEAVGAIVGYTYLQSCFRY